MLRRSKTSTSGQVTFDNDGKKQERSSNQTVWIIALILILGFFLLMSEKKYIMLMHVRQFFGITFSEAGKVNLIEGTHEPKLALDSAARSNTVSKPAGGENKIAQSVKGTENSCKWREDQLVGKCFGLQKQEGTYATQQICEQRCCEVGWDCITYQWRQDMGCFFGDIVRLGLEGAPTGNWCEPSKPSQWTGKRLVSRESSICSFGEENLSGQCYGLGVKKPPTTSGGCEKLCCETDTCEVWQFRDDKGCFIGKSNNCDRDVLSWFGRRKPTPEWRAKGLERPKDS